VWALAFARRCGRLTGEDYCRKSCNIGCAAVAGSRPPMDERARRGSRTTVDWASRPVGTTRATTTTRMTWVMTVTTMTWNGSRYPTT